MATASKLAKPAPTVDSYELVGSTLPTLSARERSIPIRTGELTDLLIRDPGLSKDESTQLGRLARMLSEVFHFEFHGWIADLKELYHPLDPDSDCLRLKVAAEAHDRPVSPPPSAELDEAFLGPFEAALIRANYLPLDAAALEKAISAPNEMGLDYVPDLRLFEHLRVWVRGHCRVTRVIRRASAFFRKKTVTFDAYRRVIIALRYRPSVELDEYVRSDVMYLRLFKDVPYVEMDMHLPEHGTKVRMRWIDKLQIASPVMTGLPTIAAKLLLEATISPMLMVAILFAPISAGLRSFFGYRTARRRYLHYMIRHLYYLTLANNSSVITRIVDSAEEEEYKEAILAYFVLWRAHQTDPAGPWDQDRLDRAVEALLRERTGVELDFETGDALSKLFRLNLVERNAQGHLRPVPIEACLESLDRRWDRFFHYNHEADRTGTTPHSRRGPI